MGVLRMKSQNRPQGYGSLATGGRGGQEIDVTNLNDSGAGSFRDAVLTSGPRIVTVKVNGTLIPQSQIDVKGDGRSNLTLRTAPGYNFALRGGTDYETPPLQFWDIHNLVVEEMKLLGGPTNIPGGSCCRDGVTLVNVEKFRLSRNLILFGLDGCIDSHNVHQGTFENNLVAIPLHYSNHKKGRHGLGGQIWSLAGAFSKKLGWSYLTVRNNVYAAIYGRGPWLKEKGTTSKRSVQGPVSVINHIVYDYMGSGMDIAWGCNVVGCRGIVGPDDLDSGVYAIIYSFAETLDNGLYVRDNLTKERTSESDPEWVAVGRLTAPEIGGPAPADKQSLTPFGDGLDICSIERAANLEAWLLGQYGLVRRVGPSQSDATMDAILSRLAARTLAVINAVESDEVTVGPGSDAPPGDEPRDTPNWASIVPNPWNSWGG